MYRRAVAGAWLAGLAVLATACGRASEDADPARLQLAAAFYPLAEAAAEVGGEAVNVSNVTPAGSEPHELELSSDRVDTMEDADVVVYVGGGFQPAVEDVASRRREESGPTIDVLDHVERLRGDPHFWLDPRQMIAAVDAIEVALSDAAPEGAPGFAARAETYRQTLRALDTEFERGLASCARREFVTTHDAFGYLAARYGLEQFAISGLAPESEADPGRLDELTREIENRGVTTVFYEDLVAPDVAETLAREAGVRTDVLSPLEGLTAEQASSGEDYVSVMRTNLAALRRALECT